MQVELSHFEASTRCSAGEDPIIMPQRSGNKSMRVVGIYFRWTLLSWAALIGLYALSLRYFVVADNSPAASRVAAQSSPAAAADASIRR
jgi:hypothetical protein